MSGSLALQALLLILEVSYNYKTVTGGVKTSRDFTTNCSTKYFFFLISNLIYD